MTHSSPPAVAHLCRRPHTGLLRVALFCLTSAALFNGTALAGGPSTWKQTSEADFKSGVFAGMVATNLGDLKLSRATKTLLEQDARVSSVYSLAQTPDGTIYAGTGPQGVVLKINGDKVETAFTIENSVGVFAMAVDAKGRLLLGVGGETGGIYRVEKAGAKPVEIYSSTDVQYIWAIKVAADGTIFAATGPNGQLIAISPEGKSKVLFDSTESNLLSLAYDGKQTLYAGSDPDGILYRIDTTTGKAFVLYDAPETEISALALDAAGNLYAGTAQDIAATGEPSAASDQAGRPEAAPGGPSIPTIAPSETPPNPNPGRPEPEPRQELPSGDDDGDMVDTTQFAGTQPVAGDTDEAAVGGNAIYRIDPAGFVTELFRQNARMLCIVEHKGILLVGTGGEGSVYQLNPAAEENIVVAKFDPKQVMTMLPIADGRILLGLANAGGIAAMSEGFADRGTFTSDVLDAHQVSRFGMVQLHGSLPADTSATLATRSGNLKDANSADGWSKWSAEKPVNTFVSIDTPPGRFFQYRLTLKSDKGNATPTVTDVQLTYQVPNLPPVVKSIKLEPAPKPEGANVMPMPGLVEASASDRNRIQIVSWSATDANDDSLIYTLSYRQVDAKTWTVLKDDLKDATYTWDTQTIADGRYELRVTASDSLANAPGMGRQSARVSDPVTVDNTAPVFDTAKAAVATGEVKIDVKASDKTSTISEIAYSVDSAKDWQAVASSDSIYDSPVEAASFSVKSLSAGPHQIAVRATDSNGNQGFSNLAVSVPDKK
jgi:hypothetical protein